MSTESQIRANRENAQHSTGPQTESGKAASCMNNFRFGFTGAFTVLASEDQDEFDHLFHGLSVEHQVKTMTERVLVLKMAQHHWLSQRAQRLQDAVMTGDALTLQEKERMDESAILSEAKTQKMFALFLRYQTTNDRAFTRALNDLLKLKAEKRKQRLDEAALCQRAEDVNKIGFESQERKRNAESQKQAAESRREAAEKRKQELHKWAVMLAEAKVDHQMVLTNDRELDQIIAEAKEQRQRVAERAETAA